MSDTVGKTDNFLKAIEKYAEQQRSQIESEAEDFKEKELDKAEEEGLREAYDLIQKKMANINISIAGELSRAENASKKKIFMRRQEIEQEVFEQAEKKLVEYTQSAKYLERLQKSAKDISDVLTADDVVLYVKAQDMKYADKIRSAFKGKCKVEASAESDGYVMPYCDCPLDGERVGESVYMDILYRAKHYVHIMTPYLILDNELETALKYAAQRGVDVKIILPGIPDKKIAYSLAKSHYSQLVKYGVKIYEYDPGFVHAKIFVSDNEKAVVGTINLDYRSLYHHFECATYMYKTSCVSEIEADYQETLKKCSAVTNESIKNEKIFYKVFGAIVKILAPLM